MRAAIVGGGISGLASAFRIAELGCDVTLFESTDTLGGLATSFAYTAPNGETCELEKFYHCLLPNDDSLLRLVRDVGLEGDLLWRGTSMGFMVDRRIHPLNTPLDLLGFSPLRLDERLRLGFMAVWARLRGTNPRLDDVTAAEWIRGIVGERAFELIWKPLLAAKIGDSYDRIPALWMSSRLHREKNTEKERKGVLRGGYRSLVEAIERGLRARGARIRLGVDVRAIEAGADDATVVLSDGARERFDFVVSTAPLPAFQRMTQGVPIAPATRDLELDYQGVVSGVLLLDKPLSTHYWMPFVASGATSQGVIEMSNLMPLDRSAGLYVCYFVNYTHRASELYARGDAEMLDAYRRDLDALFPHVGARVVDAFLFRAPFVEPIWTLGYSRRKPPLTAVHKRVYMVSTAQLYPRVNSWNSCCEVVDELVPEIVAQHGALAARAREAA